MGTQPALMAALGLSTLGILTVWFGPHDPSAPVPAVASAASGLMLTVCCSAVRSSSGSAPTRSARRRQQIPRASHPLHGAVRRRTWGFISTAALGATALEVSRAGTHRMPRYGLLSHR